MTEVEMFKTLFEGRTDAYGSWEGGSVKSVVTEETFANHLQGKELIGIYPLTLGNTVKWGCSDIDVDDIDSARTYKQHYRSKAYHHSLKKPERVFMSGCLPMIGCRVQ